MEKISWCCNQKKGIRLVEPNEDISNSYIKKSSESLEMIGIANKTWKVICSYYSCYDILYALLQRYGIKCEIHDCSIELMSIFDIFTKEDIEFMKDLKQNRIDAQYYVNKNVGNIEVNKVKEFVLKVSEAINIVKESHISKIRNSVLGRMEEKEN